eukprot:scaffold286_cov169-Amphora_coffeaeformis.AAC.17
MDRHRQTRFLFESWIIEEDLSLFSPSRCVLISDVRSHHRLTSSCAPPPTSTQRRSFGFFSREVRISHRDGLRCFDTDRSSPKTLDKLFVGYEAIRSKIDTSHPTTLLTDTKHGGLW